MPRTDTPRRDKRATLTFLETAREFYGPAFGTRRARNLERARDDWADLPEEDRSFALGHLLYLNLMAQAATTRLLLQVRDVLEEIADGLDNDGVDELEPEALDDEFDDEPEEDEPFEAPQAPTAPPRLGVAGSEDDDEDGDDLDEPEDDEDQSDDDQDEDDLDDEDGGER